MSHLPPPPPCAGRCRTEIWVSEKVSRYTGVLQLQLRVSRYTVQLRGGDTNSFCASLGPGHPGNISGTSQVPSLQNRRNENKLSSDGMNFSPRSLLLSRGGCHPNPRLGPILGLSRSHPGSEVVPSRFAMCFVLQCLGPIQVPRWGPSRPVPVPCCSRAFLPGSGAWTGRNRLLGHF